MSRPRPCPRRSAPLGQRTQAQAGNSYIRRQAVLERGKGSEQPSPWAQGTARSQALRAQALPVQPWTVRDLAVTAGQASAVP